MLNRRDLTTLKDCTPITINGVRVGTLDAEYEVQAYTDVSNLKSTRTYFVAARLRIIIPGGYTFAPGSISSFGPYPAAIANRLSLVTSAKTATIKLLDYFPKTINTSINTSQNTSDDNGSSRMSQHTTGSSTSETNTFEVSSNVGFFGDLITGGVSTGESDSVTNTSSVENTKGRTSNQNHSTSMSSGMTVKDWGSYARTGPDDRDISWLWGQEYPWNILKFHDVDGNGNVVLPPFVQKLLYDGMQVYPPSELSLHGVNFHASAKWLISMPEASESDETLTFTHDLTYYTGTHQLRTSGGTKSVVATLNDNGSIVPHQAPALDLPLFGLDPITTPGAGNGALVGFALQEYLLPPSSTSEFRILSGSNNLYVTGEGFTAPVTPDGLTTATILNGKDAQMTISFKVVTIDQELSLYLRHWKTTAQGCLMTVVVNGHTSSPIIRHVDAFDASDGSDNITTIILRNKGYAQDDYYNYLVMGLNTITVTIKPTADNQGDLAGCCYVIRALAIG